MEDSTCSIPVIYQDEYLIVVNKPIDLPVHTNDFLEDNAPYLTKILSETTGKPIYNVHRMDAKTSGVIVFAFSPETARSLSLQFDQKTTRKTFYAIVQGNPGNGTFTNKLQAMKKKKFKKEAITHFKTLGTVQTGIAHKGKRNVELSLVEIFPETSRWHQIRQHFAKNRFDVVGDIQHGDFALNKILMEIAGAKRLMLHAGELEIFHPVRKETIVFKADLPADFGAVLAFFMKK
jgi:tRNA pseudouridine65 synthase